MVNLMSNTYMQIMYSNGCSILKVLIYNIQAVEKVKIKS